MERGRRASDRRRERAGRPDGDGSADGPASTTAEGAARESERSAAADAAHAADADAADADAGALGNDAPTNLGEADDSVVIPPMVTAGPQPAEPTRGDRRPLPPTEPGRGQPSAFGGADRSAEASFVRAVRRSSAELRQGGNDVTAVAALKEVEPRRGGKLIVFQGSERRVVPLGVTPALVGRTVSADVRIEEPTVSLRHLELRHDGRAFTVLDLGSTSGTLVNGRAIVGETALRHGDLVQLGKIELRFLRDAALPQERPREAPPAPAPVTTRSGQTAGGSVATLAGQLLTGLRSRESSRAGQTQSGVTANRTLAPTVMRRRVRRLAGSVIALSVGLLLSLVAARVVYTRFFDDKAPAQIRAQVAQLLADGRRQMLALDVDTARDSARAVLAFEPQNAEAESLLRMALTEGEARDAINLALRLGDEDKDAEALQVLRRVPNASVFAARRDQLVAALGERMMLKSRRNIATLLDDGKLEDAKLAAEAHLKKWPKDLEAQALLDVILAARARVPKNPVLARARALFASGDVAGARAAALDGGAMGYVKDLDHFTAALERGKGALARLDGPAALPPLDDAFRLLAPLGGNSATPIFAGVRTPFANALYLSGNERLERGDSCGAARDLLRSARVGTDDAKVEERLRTLQDRAEAGLQRARAARVQDPDRAAAEARESLCLARSGTKTFDELKALARL